MELLNNIDEKTIVVEGKKKRGRPTKYSMNYHPPNVAQLEHNKNSDIITTLRITTNEINEINVSKGLPKILCKNTDDETVKDDRVDEKEILITPMHSEKNESMYSQNHTFDNTNKKTIKDLMKENEELKKQLNQTKHTFQTNIVNYNVGFIDNLNNNVNPLEFKNICCRYCHEYFNNLPVFLPTKKKNNLYVKMGGGFSFSFCSFNCAQTFNSNLTDGDVNNRQMLLKHYFYEIFKNDIKDISDIIIPSTPPLEFLKKLGGELTIEEWREKSKVIGKEYIIQYPVFSSTNYFIDEINDNEKRFAGCFINNNPSGLKSHKN